MESIALERIAFQTKTILANKIIAACQAAIDELKISRKMDGDKVVFADNNRIKKANKLLSNTFKSELIKICKEELNLNLEVFMCNGAVYLNGATYTEYKAYAQGDYWMTILSGREMFSGTKEYNPAEYDIDYFKKYSDNVDLEAGKLKSFTTEHTTYFWLYASMFMSEELVDPKKLSPVTAEEAAAVILHEIGHAQTILEHMADFYHRAEVATNTVKYLNEKADDKALNHVVFEVEANPIKKDENLEIIETSLGKVKNKLSNFAPVVAIFFGIVFIMTILTMLKERFDIASQFGKINSTFKKTSDTVVTQSNRSYVERIADEFVSRQGLGAALAEALAKSIKYDELGHQYDNFSEAVKALGFVQTTLLSYKVIFDFLGPIFSMDDGTYDPDWLRLEHLLLNSMVVFKDDTLDDQTRNYFLKETKTLIDVVNKFKGRKTFKLKQLLWGTIFRILSRSSISDSFSTAGLSADYDTLQLMTNGLIKNRLLYHAARLKSI